MSAGQDGVLSAFDNHFGQIVAVVRGGVCVFASADACVVGILA